VIATLDGSSVETYPPRAALLDVDSCPSARTEFPAGISSQHDPFAKAVLWLAVLPFFQFVAREGEVKYQRFFRNKPFCIYPELRELFDDAAPYLIIARSGLTSSLVLRLLAFVLWD